MSERIGYVIKEIFSSLQGEGHHAGRPAVFVRFAGCNMSCSAAREGFDCDTDFANGQRRSLGELIEGIERSADRCRYVIFTGGEPALQVDRVLVATLQARGFDVAMETNGTINVEPLKLDWLSVSPKHGSNIQQTKADEVRYVVAAGTSWPTPMVDAKHMFLSPASHEKELHDGALDYVVCLLLREPERGYRLSVQQHKVWGVR